MFQGDLVGFARSNKDIDFGWSRQEDEEQQRQRLTTSLRQIDAGMQNVFAWNPRETLDLDYAFFGGIIDSGAAWVVIPNGSIALLDNAVNFVERVSVSGVVQVNQVGFTYPSHIPMAMVTTKNGVISDYKDERPELGGASGGGGGGCTNFPCLLGTILDAQVPVSAVVQHEAALTIDWSQLTGESLQAAYDSLPAVPQLVVPVATPLTIELAAATGSIFAVRDSAGADVLRALTGAVDTGPAGRRLMSSQFPDATGRLGTELWPDDFTISTATGTLNAAFFTTAARTITLNIPGGGGLGNETAPGGMNFSHTVRFEDQGFVFASQLLINAAVQVECAANVGPLYLFLDQYKTYADGGARICSQHNCIRAQPSWGPNINGGSITQTSVILFLLNTTVDATVGSAAITAWTGMFIASPNLIAGGTIGTWTGIELADITGPSGIIGIDSAMSTGFFILHTGIAPSFFGGDVRIADGAAIEFSTVDLFRSAPQVLRMIGVGGTNNEGLDWDLDPVIADTIDVQSSTGAGLGFNLASLVIGTAAADPTANWQFQLAPGARTIILAGDFSRALFTVSANATIDAALSNFFSWIINEPSGVLGTGSVVDAGIMKLQTAPSIGTNRYGLLITSNPSGGTLNYALRVTLGDARFDGRVDINNLIALGGGAAATLGTIGGSGPTAAAQAAWVEIDVGGVAHWIPAWT